MSRNFLNRILRIIDPDGSSPFTRDFLAVRALLESDDDLMFRSDEELLDLARARYATATPVA